MRKLAWVTLGFGIASVILAYWYPSWVWVAAVAAPIVGFLLLLGQKFFRFLRVITAITLGFALGAGWFWIYDTMYLANVRVLDGKISSEVMEVAGYSCETAFGYACDVIYERNGQVFHGIAYLDKDPGCKPGDSLQGVFRFRFTAHGGEKEPAYRRGSGVYLTFQQIGDVILHHAEQIPWKYYPSLWNNKIMERIDLLFPKDAAAFAKGLLLGDKIDLEYSDYTAFRISGISHIIAVSGLHVGILIALLYFLTGRRRFLSCILGIPLLIAFAALVGFRPSVNRACMMQGLVLISLALDREYDGITALSFSAMVLMLINPMVVIDIGFQLSFASVLGIFLFAEKIHDWFVSRKWMGIVKGKQLKFRLKRWFIGTVSVTLSATVMTTPLVAYYFGTVSLVGVITNLAILWVIPFVFYSTIAAIGLSAVVPVISSFIAFPAIALIRYVLFIARTIAKLPFAAIYTASFYTVLWLIAVYILLAVFLLIKRKSVPGLLAGMLAVLLICIGFTHLEPRLDDFRLTVLDVGQGQCLLISWDGKNYMVDCGGSYDTSTADLASETLLSRGIHHLDGLILTHFDRDHCGAVPYLSERIEIDSLYYPDVPQSQEIRSLLDRSIGVDGITVTSETTISTEQGSIRLLPSTLSKSDNESCLSILFQHEKCDILITGDLSALGETVMLHQYRVPKVDVLIAGHHGSNSSTGEYLLKTVQPELVVISVGKNNSYHLPGAELLARLEDFGCTVYRTDLNGTIIYRR